MGNAAQVVQYDPVAGSVVYVLDTELINDDAGAIYDSASLTYLAIAPDGTLTNLAAAIQQLQNQTNTAQGLQGAWAIGPLPDPVGEVNVGWSLTLEGDGSYAIGHIGGIPDLSWDVWNNTQANPAQDMMYIRLSIPLGQLDGDGDGWSAEDDADYSIRLLPLAVTNFVGVVDSLNFFEGEDQWGAQPKAYALIPHRLPKPGIKMSGLLELTVTNLTPGTSNTLEFATSLHPPDWTASTNFWTWTASTNLPLPAPSSPAAFYRILSE